ncbi:MAG: hypothetical protein M3384_09185 [Acidobacteriota bacterium]|nr:hypothetical protein [Acidobacteriota bacterium]
MPLNVNETRLYEVGEKEEALNMLNLSPRLLHFLVSEIGRRNGEFRKIFREIAETFKIE